MITGIELIEFGRDDIENIVASFSPAEVDKLAFGAIQVDAKGEILQYNVAEGAITGRDPAAMKGKNFFSDVAPCTQTPRFKGIFDAGVSAGDLRTLIEYTFDFLMEPTKVRIHMKKSLFGDTYWIFVKPVYSNMKV